MINFVWRNIMQYQIKEYVDFMEKNIEQYLKTDKGLIINGDYY